MLIGNFIFERFSKHPNIVEKYSKCFFQQQVQISKAFLLIIRENWPDLKYANNSVKGALNAAKF